MDSQGSPWKELPDAPGVYFFIAPAGEILYVGRATSLRDRVRSYFNDDVIHTRGALIVDMVFQAAKIDFIQTDSVLEAVILEANLIKKHQPYFNTKEKSDKSFNCIVLTQEAFPRVLVMRGKDVEADKTLKVKALFGPYTQPTVLREGLKLVRKIFPFRDKCEPGQGKACFNRQLDLCPGVCTGEISAKEYGETIARLRLFLEGKKTRLISGLEKDMKALAKQQKFEEAHEIKKTIFALNHIQDIALLKSEDADRGTLADAAGVKFDEHGEKITFDPAGNAAPQILFRIEAYDVAHMSGRNMVGVMTVLEGRELKKADYRMFKIKRATDAAKVRGAGSAKDADDIASLKEVLDRRLNHPEWQFPNLIVVDGSTAQKNAAEEVLKQRNFDIAVVAVVKNDAHKPERILAAPEHKEIVKKFSKEIFLLNNEAHRFSIKYHRKLRGRIV